MQLQTLGAEGFAAILVTVVGAYLLIALVTASVRRSAMVGVALLGIFALNRPVASALLPAHLRPILNYADDGALGLCFVTMWFSPSREPSRVPTAAWFGFGIFALSGIAGGVAHGVPWSVLAYGTWLALKLPVAIWVCSGLQWTPRSRSILNRLLLTILCVTAVVSVVELVAPSAVEHYFGASGTSKRFGLPPLKGIFGHPAQSSTFLVVTLAVLLSDASISKRRLFSAVASVLALFSLRAKTFVDVAVIYSLRAVLTTRATARAFAPLVVLLVVGSTVFAGGDLIQSRLTSLVGPTQTSPRHALYATSLTIASQNAPVGVGFGRFGSQVSVSPYSPVYEQYGLDRQYGFSPRNPVYAQDAGWATALGEAGWLGAAGLLFALVTIWVVLARAVLRGGRHRMRIMPAFLFLGAFLIDSLASPRLFDGLACVSLGVLLGLARSGVDAVPTSDGSRESWLPQPSPLLGRTPREPEFIGSPPEA